VTSSGPADESFEVSAESRRGLLRIAVRGELDIATAPRLGAAMAAAAGHRAVLVDLSSLSFIDVAGLHALLEAERAADAAGGMLAIVNPADAVSRMLALSGSGGRLRFLLRDPGR
jgi:anti-sigma B factor antagonist